ncbi:SMI1/KNR4 family protein [Kitasatospora sp. NPDC057223]|uniref:SMI1/KNR4 family protein n=1 Tax=Kitasatospora sp. NPDC057223 TaxID=3346055 RepID=UPI003644F992
MDLILTARETLGSPRKYSTIEVWEEIEREFGISLPGDYKGFISAYGPGQIGRFLTLLHPGSGEDSLSYLHKALAPSYRALFPQKIPYPILPEKDGALLWGLTDEGDACFLIPINPNQWAVGIWFRQWAEWWESEDSFSDWMSGIISGHLEIDGFTLGRGGAIEFLAE